MKKGDKREREREKKEKKRRGFRERCRFLSEVLSSSGPHFWMPRYTERLSPPMRLVEMGANKNKQKLPVFSLSGFELSVFPPPTPPPSLPSHLPEICQVSDTCSASKKIRWIEALFLPARAVSLCKTRDTVTGGYCWARARFGDGGMGGGGSVS